MKNLYITKEKIINFTKERYIYIFAYLYLFSSVIIFLLGNLKNIISIPLSIILSIALFKAILNSPKMETSLFSNRKMIIIIVLLIAIWVTVGGIGGFIWQNRWDHKFRNALFKDLVSNNWPVIQGDKALCYYFGFWLPSAIFGKIFGLTAGYAFQTFWAALGVFLAFGMMCQYLGKVKIKNLIIFILFSGLDIFLFIILSDMPIKQSLLNILKGTHLENAAVYFQASSNTTTIFWIYNQIIPFWVGMMLLLQQKNNRSIIYIYSLMLLYSPFPLVGLAPVMVYWVLKKQDDISEKNILKNVFLKVKKVCTFENIVSLFLVVVLALFFKSNISANKLGVLSINFKSIYLFFMHFFFEYIIYLLFIYKYNRKNPILNILLITVFFLSFVKIGNGNDFAMRTNLPLIFYMSLLVMKCLQQKSISKIVKGILIYVLCLGAITPMTEFVRTISHEIIYVRIEGKETSRSDSLSTIFDKNNNVCYENFVASRNSIFFKYLAKQNEKID